MGETLLRSPVLHKLTLYLLRQLKLDSSFRNSLGSVRHYLGPVGTL